jgi:hypothetical protein
MTIDRRMALLKGALAVLCLAAGVSLSPLFVPDGYAQQQNRCSVTCPKGSCNATGNCTCTCSIFMGIAVCSCSSPTAPETDPGNG